MTPSTLAEEFTGTVECLGKLGIKLLQFWCNYQQGQEKCMQGVLNRGCPVVHSGLCVGLSVVG